MNVIQGRIQGGRTRRAPLKLEKNKIFWRKIVIFHTKYPTFFYKCAPLTWNPGSAPVTGHCRLWSQCHSMWFVHTYYITSCRDQIYFSSSWNLTLFPILPCTLLPTPLCFGFQCLCNITSANTLMDSLQLKLFIGENMNSHAWLVS